MKKSCSHDWEINDEGEKWCWKCGKGVAPVPDGYQEPPTDSEGGFYTDVYNEI